MKWLDAAEHILREANTAVPYREIGEAIVRRDLVRTRSKTPSITLHASISLDVKRRQDQGLPPHFLIRPGGVVTLAEWEVAIWSRYWMRLTAAENMPAENCCASFGARGTGLRELLGGAVHPDGIRRGRDGRIWG